MRDVVLFVDDERAALQGLERSYRNEQYEILTAERANQALEILSGFRVGVVVSDNRMPGIEGIELMSELRQHSPETVRIMLTGDASYDLPVRAINEGHCYRFFHKPYNPIEPGIAIRSGLQLNRNQRKAAELLNQSRNRNDHMAALEKRYPGITWVNTDKSGRLRLSGSEQDLESLITELERELMEDQERFDLEYLSSNEEDDE